MTNRRINRRLETAKRTTAALVFTIAFAAGAPEAASRAEGYRGIWYSNQPSGDEYAYKYSGGLGTYCAKHIPLAVYAPGVERTFFVWGGASKDVGGNLLAMISWYDHKTRTVPRPVILMDKKTRDAHDNPVLAIDGKGCLWVFVSAHGTARPAYIYRSARPYDIESFELVLKTNFSYPQPWFVPGRGFFFLHTLYRKGRRFLFWSRSSDGRRWTEPKLLSAMERGHYQISCRRGEKIGTAFNFHPEKGGLNHRTDLCYVETGDMGRTWTTAAGKTVTPPFRDPASPRPLVHDYRREKLLVYLKDLNFDSSGNPVILFLTAKGYAPGPANDPRTWRVARWTGTKWSIHTITESDNNYDTGCLHIEKSGAWIVVGPTEPGPQRYNTGGEMAVWRSEDEGVTWKRERLLTEGSRFNHSYARRPVAARPAFYTFWADGHGRKPSPSSLYFYDRSAQKVYVLPRKMSGETAHPHAYERKEQGSK